MSKRQRKVVFFGNCQAQALARIYQTHLAFDRGDEVAYADSQNVLTDAAFGAVALHEADVVIKQIFDFPTKLAADNLRPSCVVHKFPSVVAGFYWPHASQPHILTPKDFRDPPYPAQLGDRYLNSLIVKNVEPAQALEQYLAMDVAAVANLDRLFELYVDRQRKRDLEAGCDIATLLVSRFREWQLFLTPDHPELGVFSALARHVYQQLGVSTEEIEEILSIQTATPFPASALPLHPNLIRHYGIVFADAESRYPFLDEGKFTFAEYVMRYMNYAWNRELQLGIHGKMEPAERAPILGRALEGSPQSRLGWRVLGDTFLALGRIEDARAAADRCWSLDHLFPEAWGLRCRIALAAGDLATADTLARQAVVKFPHAPEFRHVAADIARRAGDRDRAVENAHEAVRLRRGDPAAREFLERMLQWAQGESPVAASRAEAVSPAPTAAVGTLPLDMAEKQEAAGDSAAAMRTLELYAAERPNDAHLRARIANLCLRRRDPVAAEAQFRAAIAINPDFYGFWTGLAISLADQKRFDETEETIHSITARGVQDAHVFALLARVQVRRGELAEAEKSLLRALAIDGTLTGVHNALADVCWRTGRQDEAIQILEHLTSQGTKDAHVFGRLGDFVNRRGEAERGEVLLRRAIELDASVGEFRILLALALAEQGKSTEASQVLSELPPHLRDTESSRLLSVRLAAEMDFNDLTLSGVR